MESEKISKCLEQEEGDVDEAKEKQALLLSFLETAQGPGLPLPCLPPLAKGESWSHSDIDPRGQWNVCRASPDVLAFSTPSELKHPFCRIFGHIFGVFETHSLPCCPGICLPETPDATPSSQTCSHARPWPGCTSAEPHVETI